MFLLCDIQLPFGRHHIHCDLFASAWSRHNIDCDWHVFSFAPLNRVRYGLWYLLKRYQNTVPILPNTLTEVNDKRNHLLYNSIKKYAIA